ncbi:MAG: protein kinase domain-containing protein, partial [Vulcanimicrobiota bacterium]
SSRKPVRKVSHSHRSKRPATSPAPSQPAPISSVQFSMPSGTLSVGQVIDGRYKISQHVATGGMGAIYKGEDTRLKTTVAIKEMLDFFQSDDDRKYAIQRFQEEALLLADLRHPNIPRVTDHFIEKKRYYLIMDFIQGKSTEKILQENGGRGLPLDRTITWAFQICDVLHYLHSRQPPVIYRDMKPSNVMIQSNEKVMLVDFGIARHFSPRRPGTMIGTHGYAPPEQYKGNTEPRSDLYALAATLHHLISGNDPTQGVPFQFKPIREFRQDAPVMLENILKKALENRPQERFRDGNEMKLAFQNLFNSMKGVTATGYVGGGQASSSGVNYPQRMRPQQIKQIPSAPVYQQKQQDSAVVEAQKHYELAKRLIELGQFTRAKKELKRAVSLSPYYPEAHTLLGFVLTRQGKSKDAVRHLTQAVNLTPGSATAHFYLGKALSKIGRYDEAQKEFRIAGNLDPKVLSRNNESFLEKIIRSLLT